MKKTAVVYWSGTGNTEAMAKAVAEGMESAGAQVTMLTPDQVKASEPERLRRDRLRLPRHGQRSARGDGVPAHV